MKQDRLVEIILNHKWKVYQNPDTEVYTCGQCGKSYITFGWLLQHLNGCKLGEQGK